MPALKNVSIEATRRAWVEIDLAALRANCRTLMRHLPQGCRILPMVKADGYGIGMARTVEALSPLGPWGFGVATLAEGVELRRMGWDGPIVVFAPGLPADVRDLLEERLEPAVSGLEALISCGRRARENGAALAVHLEIDTGMGRFGLSWLEAGMWAPKVRHALGEGGLRLAGTLTHFHSADTDPGATEEQWHRFREALSAMNAVGVSPGLVHAANSAGAMLQPGVHADLVRPGIYLYGGGRWEPPPELVATVKARVLDVREAPAGTTVSYGATFVTRRPSRLATLGIGYGDGLRRELSNRGRALIEGREAPIRGVVCMDSTVVDVTDLGPVRSGDVATLLGRDGAVEIGLEEMAEACGTISYEILTGLTRRLPRLGIEPGAGPTAARG
jgi:alanine racemase